MPGGRRRSSGGARRCAALGVALLAALLAAACGGTPATPAPSAPTSAATVTGAAEGAGATPGGATPGGSRPRSPLTAICPPRPVPDWLPAPASAELATLTLASGGRDRRALVVPPPGFDVRSGHPWPLLVDFHGHGQSAEVAARTHGYGPPAARAGVVVVYPQGLTQEDGRAGWSTGAPGRDVPGIDDVAFAADLLARLDRDLCLDADRRWVVGHSNGGGMVGVLACDAADDFTGFVAIGGAFYGRAAPCRPSVPVRMLEIHGDADPVIGYGGGGPLPSIPAWLDGWAARLGCDPAPTVTRAADPPAGTRSVWRCPPPAALVHLRIVGGGHGVADGAAAVALAFLQGR